MTLGEKITAGCLVAAALWIPFVMMVIEPLLCGGFEGVAKEGSECE